MCGIYMTMDIEYADTDDIPDIIDIQPYMFRKAARKAM